MADSRLPSEMEIEMEMSQLRTFRAVAEALNFTRAAERLHLTQSAVSHQIKALEEELGEPLFIRAKRGVKLSQAGKIALEYVERILDETEAMRERISGRERSPTGRVRVAAATQAFVYLSRRCLNRSWTRTPALTSRSARQ